MSKDAIKKASLVQVADERLQCAICSLLLIGPLQFQCGHRICTSCARKLKQNNALTFFCRQCNETVDFTNYFHDKAVAKEVDNTVISCPHCSHWTGEYRCFQGHLKDECQMVEESCPHEGCSEIVLRSELKHHMEKCLYKRHASQWRNQDTSSDTLMSPKYSVAKEKSTAHQCCFAFLGCQFVGSNLELSAHIEKDTKNHLNYICKYLLDQTPQKQSNGFNNEHSHDYQVLQSLLHSKFESTNVNVEQLKNETDQTKLQVSKVQDQQNDVTFRLNGIEDLLATIQASITEINRTYEEVSLTLQTLQATSYDGKYIWKIPDITRRRRDALLGKTVSLYSAPFYTDRFGYRLCLRVYLDGDGSGKGHYISYFLTIMKGEYDALLEWPFQLTVTMMMINQKGNSNIVQSFKPNPNSVSFHRPKSDMNVASGCPKFAALSVLDNPEFIVDDVAFFQCVVSAK